MVYFINSCMSIVCKVENHANFRKKINISDADSKFGNIAFWKHFWNIFLIIPNNFCWQYFSLKPITVSEIVVLMFSMSTNFQSHHRSPGDVPVVATSLKNFIWVL